MNVKLLIVSHGNLAKEALTSAEMIAGKIPDATAIEMTAEEGNLGIEKKLEAYFKVQRLAQDTLVFVDLFGGTPGNEMLKLVKKYPHTYVITGFNLGMILEYAFIQAKTIAELVEAVVISGKTGIQFIELAEADTFTDDEIEID